jgi:nucleoid-associated protein EbfC
MLDMFGMLGKMKELQARMKEAQDSLVTLRASAEAGAGMVKATVNGKKQVLSIEIDADMLKPEDREMIQDLVVAAVNLANQKVEDMVKDHLQGATEGLIPNIPGMDLGAMFK